MWAARKTRFGCGSRCVDAPGKWWPGITDRAQCSAVGRCGTRFRPLTKRVSSSPTSGAPTKTWCLASNTALVPSKTEKQIMSRDSTSRCASASAGSPARPSPSPKATSCTSSTSELSSLNTTDTASTDSINLTALDHYRFFDHKFYLLSLR